MNVHTDAVYTHRALQLPLELAELARILEPYDVASVLELGSAFGGMLWWYRHALAAETIVSVDHSIQYPAGLVDHCIAGPTGDPAVYARVRELARELGRFDLVFIDAAGTLDEVRRDWTLYGPLGRIVAFHDISDEAPANCGRTAQFWFELKRDRPELELAEATSSHEYRNGYGIGVVFQ